MCTAIGRIAGPDRPPLPVPRIGRRFLVSMRMPSTVLMAVKPSAPASSTARATAARPVSRRVVVGGAGGGGAGVREWGAAGGGRPGDPVFGTARRREPRRAPVHYPPQASAADAVSVLFYMAERARRRQQPII